MRRAVELEVTVRIDLQARLRTIPTRSQPLIMKTLNGERCITSPTKHQDSPVLCSQSLQRAAWASAVLKLGRVAKGLMAGPKSFIVLTRA